MRYNLADALQRKNAQGYWERLMAKGATVELTEKVRRTLNQNAFLHLLCGYFGAQIGETTEYVKRHYYKWMCNKDVYLTTKTDKITGQQVQDLRSSKDLSKEEMALTITRFKEWAALLDPPIYLPDADNPDEMASAQDEVYKNREWL